MVHIRTLCVFWGQDKRKIDVMLLAGFTFPEGVVSATDEIEHKGKERILGV